MAAAKSEPSLPRMRKSCSAAFRLPFNARRVKSIMNKEPNRTAFRWRFRALLLLLPVWVSCQTGPHLVLQPVGPAVSEPTMGRLDLVGIGFLRVYSATETRQVGKFINY